MSKTVTVKLTLEELEMLLRMADNQLFRIKFIDTKFPGHMDSSETLRVAQSAVHVLQKALSTEKGITLKEAESAHAAS